MKNGLAHACFTQYAPEGSLCTEGFDVRPAVAGGSLGEFRLEAIRHGRPPGLGVNVQNSPAGHDVRQRKSKLAIKTPGSAQSRVYRINAVGGAYDDHLAAVVQPIHQSQHGAHDRGMDLILLLAADRSQAIDFIEKNDGWLHAFGLFKQQPQLTLCLTHPLAQAVRSFAHEERHAASVDRTGIRQRARHKGLAGTCATAQRRVQMRR